MQEASTMWDECSEVDIGGVHPQQGKECLRQRCVSGNVCSFTNAKNTLAMMY